MDCVKDGMAKRKEWRVIGMFRRRRYGAPIPNELGQEQENDHNGVQTSQDPK